MAYKVLYSRNSEDKLTLEIAWPATLPIATPPAVAAIWPIRPGPRGAAAAGAGAAAGGGGAARAGGAAGYINMIKITKEITKVNQHTNQGQHYTFEGAPPRPPKPKPRPRAIF